MEILCKIRHGSHLYGTNTPESDLDYKGVYLPSFDEVILGNYKSEIDLSTNKSNQKNSNRDVDEQYISLQKFLTMAYSGETIAIDMLHAGAHGTIEASPEWQFIVDNRHRLYTKNMKAFLGYCTRQAAKYRMKGSRIEACEYARDYLKKKAKCHKRLNSSPIIQMGLEGVSIAHPDYVKVIDGFHKGDKWVDKDMLVVCESKYEFTMKIEDVITSLDKKIASYGDRAQLAKNNGGLDWKAIHHSFRAASQLEEIYTTGDLKFPLADRKFLLEIKQGKLNFNELQQKLEEAISKIKKFAAESTFPEQVDKTFFENYLIGLYKNMATSH